MRARKSWAPKGRRRAAAATAALMGMVVAAMAHRWQATHPAWRALCGLMPTPGTTQVGPVRSVRAANSYAYLVMGPSEPDGASEAVLIDTGSDPTGQALLAALGDAHLTVDGVRHVLLTHGHQDHTAALALFPHATVHVAQEDGALALGDVGPRSWAMRLAMRLGHHGHHRPPLAFVVPGQRLRLSGIEIEVVGLAGHTLGSVGYLVAGGLVAGDAVYGPSGCGTKLVPYPRVLADGPKMCAPVLERLGGRPLAFVADGHTGITARAACAQRPPPP